MRSKFAKLLLVLCVGAVAGFPLMGGVAAGAGCAASGVGRSGGSRVFGDADADRIAALEKKLNAQAAAIARRRRPGITPGC